jgi:tRNA G10  N-methylase Trm11
LYCPNWFELDPCFSIGSFYEKNGIKSPTHKFDIEPQAKGVIQASAEKLPIASGSIQSIMFDPPFLATSGPVYEESRKGIGESNIITGRFSAFQSREKLWEWYKECLIEFKRVLKNDGVLVFKCQDAVSSAKNYFSHCFIMNKAVEAGFYPKDMFILLAKNRIIGGNHAIQQHARKFHCYYWVFINADCKVNYRL